LLATLEQKAGVEQSTMSRVVDRLLRQGLVAEEAGGAFKAAAGYMMSTIELLERWPFYRDPEAVDVVGERGLVGGALAGRDEAIALMTVLDADIINSPLHTAIWSMLRAGDVIQPGESGEHILPILSRRFGPEDIPQKDADEAWGKTGKTWGKDLAEYVAQLRLHGETADIARSALGVVDAFMARQRRPNRELNRGDVETHLQDWIIGLGGEKPTEAEVNTQAAEMARAIGEPEPIVRLWVSRAVKRTWPS
jgi:hypothetical protein